MKVEFINPFITAGISVISQLIGGDVEQGQLAIRSGIFTTQQISILVWVSGQVEGCVTYGMSQVTATKIAAAMIDNPRVVFDEMSLSAISELGNIISGNAAHLLAESNYLCDLTPPTLIRGVNVEIPSNGPSLVVPLYLRCGKVDINVSLVERLHGGPASAEG